MLKLVVKIKKNKFKTNIQIASKKTIFNENLLNCRITSLLYDYFEINCFR
jgi:hypothetical protein